MSSNMGLLTPIRLVRKVSEVSEMSEPLLGLFCLEVNANNCCGGLRKLDASCTLPIGSALGSGSGSGSESGSAVGSRAGVLRCWTPATPRYRRRVNG
jgi:hypothetical protein